MLAHTILTFHAQVASEGRKIIMSKSDDTISRRAAVEALYDWEMCYDWDEHCREEDPKPAYIVSPSDVIEKLPSAQPERKKGEWIDYTEDGYVECPFCHSATNCDGNKDELHFCFSCGADMRGEQDG
jgi:hypothetical protein